MSEALLELRRGETVRLVEHDGDHVAVPRQRPEVVVVDGGVGVLLGVQHPDELVHHLHHAVHLLTVRRGGGVVVRQVQQDQVRHPGLRGRHLVAAGHAQMVEEGGVGGGETGGQRARCRGPAGALLRQPGARQRVEQRGLARAGGAGQRHDRLTARGQPPGGTPQHRLGVLLHLFGHPPRHEAERLPQPVELLGHGGHQSIPTGRVRSSKAARAADRSAERAPSRAPAAAGSTARASSTSV